MTSRSRSSSASSSSRGRQPAHGLSPDRIPLGQTEIREQWLARYKEIQGHQWRSFAVKIMAYATGAPPSATIIMKKTPRFYAEPFEPMSDLAEFHSRLFWITACGGVDGSSGELAEDLPRQKLHYEHSGAHVPPPPGERPRRQDPEIHRRPSKDGNPEHGGAPPQNTNRPNAPATTASAPEGNQQRP